MVPIDEEFFCVNGMLSGDPVRIRVAYESNHLLIREVQCLIQMIVGFELSN